MEKNLKEGETPLFNLDDKELIRFAHKTKNNLIMDTVAPEMTRRLIIAIKEFNYNSSKQTKWIICLTIGLGVIALLQLILLFTQSLFIVSIPLLDLLTFPITSFLSN